MRKTLPIRIAVPASKTSGVGVRALLDASLSPREWDRVRGQVFSRAVKRRRRWFDDDDRKTRIEESMNMNAKADKSGACDGCR
jgi:hypothetical protein